VAAFSVAGLLATSSQAALLAYDGFNYTSGSQLTTVGALNGGTGWGGGWVQTGQRPMAVTTGGYTYLNLPSVGNGATPTNNDRPGARRALATPITSGTVYVSALVAPGGYHENWYNSYVFLADDDESYSGSFGVDAVSDSGGLWTPQIWGAGTNPNTLALASTNVANGTVNLMVAKINLDLDTIHVFVNPTVGAAEPLATIDAAFTGPSISHVGFYSSTRSSVPWDEIRIGQTFADVTPMIPEPASLGLLGLGGLAMLRRRRSH